MSGHPFGPLYGPGSRVLILGSWPSPKSREQGFYYGHPQNRFWPLMARLTGRERPGTIGEKRALILESGLALWDALESCTIQGAQDATIRDAVPTDIPGLLARSDIRAVVCNGAAAYNYYRKFAQPLTGLDAVRLPSTSPANAAWSMDRLAAAWGEALGPWLTL
ncbi:MAG: DNA-deoxyinosine glycosylase [Oscillospiraceae bacterium]|nr:DNA-deoxyinosine glycosylase [Oscillospiraceae bacterium]